jgi:hypothetical protein
MKPCLPFYSSRGGQVTGVEGERKTEREKKGKKVEWSMASSPLPSDAVVSDVAADEDVYASVRVRLTRARPPILLQGARWPKGAMGHPPYMVQSPL